MWLFKTSHNGRLGLRSQFDICPIFHDFFAFKGVDDQEKPDFVIFNELLHLHFFPSFVDLMQIHGVVIYSAPGTMISVLGISGEY